MAKKIFTDESFGVFVDEIKAYTDNAANTVKNDLLNGAGGAYDTLKELGDLIDDNKDAIDALEDIAAGKANSVHTHAISDVTNLQSALDGKANTSHGTHVTYSTTAPVMDGTASVGSATTVARSDHKHPTDTSRASKTDFDSHTANTTVHITSKERTNWNAAKTHADSAHAPSNAQPNQNAFSNIAVSGQTTVTADTTTDTVTFAGTNVSITTDATNDKVTFAVADGTTSAKGVVKLSDSVTSDSSTTAATSYSVRAAYNLADNAYDLANSKADHTHNHTVSQIGDLTVSASELNYMDGVTSNVQEQLDAKQAAITGAASTIASSNLTANRALVSNSSGKVAVSLVTATELGYLDGVTSGIQGQLDDKAAYSHTHSAAHITSGIMDAAVLPDASETAEGIVTTQSQSFAGNKTFTGKITSSGLASNGSITAGTANTYDIGSSLAPFKNIYAQNLYIDAKVVSGSVLDSGSFVREREGTASTKGITKLTVGNYISKGKAGNAEGQIKIYNENNGSVTLKCSHTDDNTPTVSLPDHMGTLITNKDISGFIEPITATLVSVDNTTSPASAHYNVDIRNVTDLYDGLALNVCFPMTGNTTMGSKLYLSINSGDSYAIFKQPFHSSSSTPVAIGDLYYLGYTTKITLAVNHGIAILSDTPVWYATDIANPAIAPSNLSSAVPVNKGGTGATTATQALTNLGAASKDYAHPIGSMLITSTNTNPSNTLGGTWELVEKSFSELVMSDTSNLKTYFTPGAGAVSYKFYGFRSGHTIDIRLSFTGSSDFSDSTASIGTLLWTQLGVNGSIPYGITGELAPSDAGNGAVMCSIAYNTGAVTAIDVITRGSGSSLSASSEYTLHTQLVCSSDNMLDSACDKFYWRRTA